MVINGRHIAERIIAELKRRPAPRKFLAAIVGGSDPATESFITQKEKIARELGVHFRVARYSAAVTERALVDEVRKYADDGTCGGVILQLPLPPHLDRAPIIAAIPLEKDVDVLRGEGPLTPPAVGVVEEILKTNRSQLKTSVAAIVGMGFLVGQPIAKWLKGKVKALITRDIGDDLGKIKNADVVILGVGKAGLVKPEMVKSGALIIDFGYSRGEDGALRGDFDVSQLITSQSTNQLAYTPTPGGTGPILVAKLFENFYALNF